MKVTRGMVETKWKALFPGMEDICRELGIYHIKMGVN